MMKYALTTLVIRDDSDDTTYDPSMVTLLIVLLVLVIVALLAVMTLLYMRYRQRTQRQESLPMYTEKRPSSSRSNHRRLNIRPSSIFVYQEKQELLGNSDAPPSPSSPVPEIRITFPEEVDQSGKRQSGRVVVVHVGDTSLGMEPHSESLPPYQQSESDRFQSLDLERIGGLKEKEMEARWQ